MKENLQSANDDEPGLARTLGPLQLTMIGVGCVIGAGIFVMTGTAAATVPLPTAVGPASTTRRVGRVGSLTPGELRGERRHLLGAQAPDAAALGVRPA